MAELLGFLGACSAFIKARVVKICESSPGLFATSRYVFAARTPERLLRGTQRGFTLVELIVASMLSITMVSSPIMSETQRVKWTTYDLYVTLDSARSAAIKQNAVATVTPRDGSYSKGYTIKVGDLVLGTQRGISRVTIKASGEEIVS